MSTTLSFVNERQFLTVIQPVLPLHECADHALAKFATEPLHSIVDSATAVEPLHSAAEPASSGVALIEAFCLYVWV
jgi:hypothetical protein